MNIQRIPIMVYININADEERWGDAIAIINAALDGLALDGFVAPWRQPNVC